MPINLNKNFDSSYKAEISRNNPTAFLFLIDQSGSMAERLGNGRSKAEHVADVMNRTLMNLIMRCTRASGTRDYFEIGVIGYGGRGVKNGLTGPLASRILHPISEIEANPMRIEERIKKEDDGAGGVFERKIKFPVWFEAEAYGGTPMNEALIKAAEVLAGWCDDHPESYPPTILHLTDGLYNDDGDPEEIVEKLAMMGTDDGDVLIFNLHTSIEGEAVPPFPSSGASLPASIKEREYAEKLFRMSSRLPKHIRGCAAEKGYKIEDDARGFMFNSDAIEIADFFDLGTRPAQMR